MCFLRLLDRNVNSKDTSFLSFETTSGINTAAFVGGPLPLDIFGILACIFAMHDSLFVSLNSTSLENAFLCVLLCLSTNLATLDAFSMIYYMFSQNI